MMEQYGLEPVDQEALDKANEFKDQIDTMKLVFMQAVQIVGTKIAGYLVPIMQKVVDKAAEIAQIIAGLDGGVLAKIMGISGALAGLSPALIIIGKVAESFGGALKNLALFLTKIPLLGRAFGLLMSPVGLVIALLAGLGIALNKSGTSIDSIVGKVTEVVQNLLAQLPGMIETIVNAIVEMAPVIFDGIVTAVQAIIALLPTLIPALVQGAVTLFNGLVQAAVSILPMLIQAIVDLVNALVAA